MAFRLPLSTLVLLTMVLAALAKEMRDLQKYQELVEQEMGEQQMYEDLEQQEMRKPQKYQELEQELRELQKYHELNEEEIRDPQMREPLKSQGLEEQDMRELQKYQELRKQEKREPHKYHELGQQDYSRSFKQRRSWASFWGWLRSDARDPDYWNVPDAPNNKNPDWMRRLADDKYFSDISVPGTHNTMARTGGDAYTCQSLSLTTQLNLGVRFLDIRCRAFGSDLPIHHAAKYQDSNFNYVLKYTTRFLKWHPSEIIFMRVKQEYSSEPDSTFDRLVRNHIKNYTEQFWLKGRIGKIEEARGKVVLLRNFVTKETPYGISYSSLKIADDYNQASYTKKFNGVKQNLREARICSKYKMFLTFNSDSFIFPRDMARTLNTKLHDYVRGKQARMGIIAMDYPGPGLIKDIIDLN